MSAAAINTNQLSENQANELFGVYRDYMNASSSHEANIYAEDFPSVEKCIFAWQKLNVSLPLDEIKKTLKKDGVLQLRSIDSKCRTLIVGCGNRPLANAAGYPIGLHDDEPDYVNRHIHEGAITINPHLASNPTLVGFFGLQAFPVIADSQFDLIVIEGTRIEDTMIGRSELKRIASKTAQILSTLGNLNGREFSWEDNSKNGWDKDYIPPSFVMDLATHPCFPCKK